MTRSRPLRRSFDLETANRSLPLVSRITGDIVRIHRRMWELWEGCRRSRDGGDEPLAAQERPDATAERLQALAWERARFVEELESIGCILKDPAIGLVDFPARHRGRIVYLCWRLGEPEVAHWHEIHAGFSARKPTAGVEFADRRDSHAEGQAEAPGA